MKNPTMMLIIGIFLISLASASTNIEVNVAASFSLNEQMSFEYSLVSDISEQVKFIPHIICPNAPIAFLQEQTIQLQANQQYTTTYVDQIVQDWFEPQTCTAYVIILSPIQKTVSKNFTIDTNPSFDFDITLDKKVFIQNEDISIDYTSDISGLDISASLTYPDGRSENIGLPTTIKAGEIGTYEIEVSASKEGYKTMNVGEQFAVIEGHAEIGGSEDVGRGENVGDDGEDKGMLVYYILARVVVFIIVFLVVLYLFFRKKRGVV